MHNIYTTSGFIIDSRAQGEAGKYLSIFTRDLGLVWAMAQGIRLEKSKLRYFTSDYSFGEFSLVRGKEVWRLTNADEIDGEKSGLNLTGHGDRADSTAKKDFWARIALLLRRLLHGEEPNPQLFKVIFACYNFLAANSAAQVADIAAHDNPISPNLEAVESLTVLRIMHALGYIGDDKEIHGFLYSNDFAPGVLDLAARKKTTINQHINKALKESHL
jgi:recombinational DNA repair protein (RecF pathway)